jgi:uncharacterized membrane protein YtjA (UPF0391 family)
MLRLATIFLIIALAAALIGFGGIVHTAVGIAQLLFVVFLTIFLLTLLAGTFRQT